jgi:capsular exopolysaccharide synthesis family protein
LGGIGAFRRRDYPKKMLVTEYPRSPMAEAYRLVRTNLQFSAIDQPIRTMIVTSSKPLEGKSLTSANLAAIIAQSGKKVILVDTDLRRPTQQNIFGISNNLGLTTALLSQVSDPREVVQDIGVENLGVIASGPLPPNPAELLGSRRMTEIIQALTQIADVVIFDTPPTLVVADANILATRVDGVVVVVDSSTTRPAMARHTINSIQSVKGHILGVVLNKVSLSNHEGYGYGYGHGSYYYGTDNTKGPTFGRRIAALFTRNGHTHSDSGAIQTK